MSDGSQQPGTPAAEDRAPSSDLSRHLYTCGRHRQADTATHIATPQNTHIHVNFRKKKKDRLGEKYVTLDLSGKHYHDFYRVLSSVHRKSFRTMSTMSMNIPDTHMPEKLSPLKENKAF